MQNPPLAISNVVLLQYAANELYVTLSSSTTTPGVKAVWSLPSAPIGHTQTSLESLEANLRHTIGLQNDDISYREQLYTSESTSPTHATICISYLYLSRGARWFKSSQQVGSFPISKLPPLSSADRATLQYALDRLHAKTLYSTISNFLLPVSFTLVELQDVFETLTRQPVDRRNFRKKILALNVLKELRSKQPSSKTDPIRYSFKHSGLQLLEKPFTQSHRS